MTTSNPLGKRYNRKEIIELMTNYLITSDVSCAKIDAIFLYNLVYEKALDDFVEKCKLFCWNNKDIIMKIEDITRIAKELKDENSNN